MLLGNFQKDWTLSGRVFFLIVPHTSVVLLSNKAQVCINKPDEKLFLPKCFTSNLTWLESLIYNTEKQTVHIDLPTEKQNKKTT